MAYRCREGGISSLRSAASSPEATTESEHCGGVQKRRWRSILSCTSTDNLQTDIFNRMKENDGRNTEHRCSRNCVLLMLHERMEDVARGVAVMAGDVLSACGAMWFWDEQCAWSIFHPTHQS